MKLKHYALLTTLITPLCSHAQTEQWSVFLNSESYSYSEALSVDAMIHDMDDELHDGDVAFTHNKIEAGMRWGQWSVSYFYRYDYYLEFDPDTMDLVYRDKNHLAVETGKDYTIDLEANHIRAKGLTLAWQFQALDTLTTKLALSYLQADKIIDGTLQGNISTTTDNTFSGQVDLIMFMTTIFY
ncbi:MAG: hypothetical protein JKY66_08105 [Spongiibacteraceae bacterium]|nr:hypothetical protein [Spongiibacteraceae bacterium]